MNALKLVGGEWRCRHPEHNLNRGVHGPNWCQHIRKYISEVSDAAWYKPGQELSVPIIPSEGIFAHVALSDSSSDGLGPEIMTLIHTNEFGSTKRIRLGFWNPGEGMFTMREVVLDFIRSQVDPNENQRHAERMRTRCPNKAHSLKASRIVQERSTNPSWRWACLWSIVMEGACLPCVEESSSVVAGNFGMDPSIL